VSAEEGFVSAAVSADHPARRGQLRARLGTAAFWLLGSAIVALAQPNSDRRLAAAGAAAAGVATILVVSRLTPDRDRRYFRAVVGAMVAISVTGDWLVQRLSGHKNSFLLYGLDTRISLPLIVVLLAPLVLGALPTRLRSRALWRERALIWRDAHPLDWLAAAYALLIVPALALGLLHHASKTYIGQDLGLIVFFVFAYVAGRTVSAEAGRVSAAEFVDLLLLMAAAQAVLGWGTVPIYTYVEAACAGAVGFALLQPKKARLLPLGLALVLLGADAVSVHHGTGSTTAIELAAAGAVIAYLAVRARSLVPAWLVVGLGVVALAGFLAATSDGKGVLGRYYGTDPSKAGRTYEAQQVREAVRSSSASFVFGRGLGGSIDETQAPKLFAESLAYGGRDLAHVQNVHLLPYEFLLKYGLLGFAWLSAMLVGAVLICLRALEKASKDRDPTLVVYAALPLLVIAAALAAATHFQDNPLNAFAVGILVTRLGDKASSRRLRIGFALPAVAVVAAVVGAIVFTKPSRVAAVNPGPQIPVPRSAIVDDLRLGFPLHGFHRRYFSSSNPAVTGGHGLHVHGVVVASYPLKANPELGASGSTFRQDGVLFELYRAPQHVPGQVAQTVTFPLSYLEFPGGPLFFQVNGHNYQAIALVGKHPSAADRAGIVALIASIHVK
jgi:hypothetical protein